MICPASIHHNAVDCARLCNNLVYSSRDAVFVRDVCLDGSNAPGKSLEYGCKLVARLGEIDRIDLCCIVDQAAFCDAETDSAVPSGYLYMVSYYARSSWISHSPAITLPVSANCGLTITPLAPVPFDVVSASCSAAEGAIVYKGSNVSRERRVNVSVFLCS